MSERTTKEQTALLLGTAAGKSGDGSAPVAPTSLHAGLPEALRLATSVNEYLGRTMCYGPSDALRDTAKRLEVLLSALLYPAPTPRCGSCGHDEHIGRVCRYGFGLSENILCGGCYCRTDEATSVGVTRG